VDTQSPVISVDPTEVSLPLGDSEPDLMQGVAATDNVDGNVTSWVIVGGERPDMGQTGTYLVTCNVTDQAGNAAVEKLRVYFVVQVCDFCGRDGPPDGYVDVWDLMQFADHWHVRTGEGSWDAKYDLTGPNFGDPDGYVDVWDLMVFADHWHEGQKP